MELTTCCEMQAVNIVDGYAVQRLLEWLANSVSTYTIPEVLQLVPLRNSGRLMLMPGRPVVGGRL